MMLTTKSRYAVMAVLEIATKSKEMPVTLAGIASKQNISLNYLEQIFIMLKKANIVKSVKGPGGGYIIHSALDKTMIASIIDAVKENIEMTKCSARSKNSCMFNKTKCNAHDLWHGLSKHIRNYFEAISIADLMASNNDLLQQVNNKTTSLKVEGSI